jgi:hypothetical protein
VTTLPTPEYLSALKLRAGCGTGKPGDRCAIQEVRAWEGLDPAKDECPPDADPLIVSLVIRVQDVRAEWRQALIPLLPQIPGSRGSDALQWRRLYRCADWQLRRALPALCDFYPEMKEAAANLRALGPVVDRKTAKLAADQLGLASARDRDLGLASARDLALALASDRDLASAIAIDLASAIASDRDLGLASARDRDPVAMIGELLAMKEREDG